MNFLKIKQMKGILKNLYLFAIAVFLKQLMHLVVSLNYIVLINFLTQRA